MIQDLGALAWATGPYRFRQQNKTLFYVITQKTFCKKIKKQLFTASSLRHSRLGKPALHLFIFH